jgi:hypothetical protein
LGDQNKYSSATILNTDCNEQTTIDFFFSSDSSLNCNDQSTACSSGGTGSSTMKFMDINGIDLDLTLSSAYLLDSSFVTVTGWDVSQGTIKPDFYFTFLFQTQGEVHQVIVLVPVYSAGNSQNISNMYNVNSSSDFLAFQSLGSNFNIKLSAFNFMNMIDYSRFFHATDNHNMTTLLLSNTVLGGIQAPSSPSAFNSPTSLSFTPDAYTGNKLCYASTETSGVFQEHLRESWPFWTCLLSVFLFWVYYLWSEAETHEVYDKKFEDNKMTCWGFYSMRYLASTQFFSVLTRESLMFFNYSFQALVLSALYSTLG